MSVSSVALCAVVAHKAAAREPLALEMVKMAHAAVAPLVDQGGDRLKARPGTGQALDVTA